jgi:hypothetical protein
VLNAGTLLFDASGKVRNTTSAPVDFNAGVGSIQGLLSADSVSPQNWVNGMPFGSAGRLSVQTTGAIVAHTQGGLPINADGRIAIDVSSPVAYRNSGLPFTSAGRLALASPEAPGTLSAFDNGFDEGFG